MFGLFKKKTQLEQLIAKDGIEHATTRFAEIVSQKLPSREVAYRFILEELDGASRGNEASQRFARDSGIPSSEYRGALNRSSPDIDGPEGPQQLLLGLSMQLMPNQPLMAEFRCKVDDKVMKRFGLGKHAPIAPMKAEPKAKTKNYAIKPNGFIVEDAESGDGLAAVIRDGEFHAAISMKGVGTGPLAPWPVSKNPFEDDNHFCGSGMSPQGPWSFSIRPSAPFSQILREAREEYARNAGHAVSEGPQKAEPMTIGNDRPRVTLTKEKKRLQHCVEKKHSTPLGVFEDLNRDLASYIEKNETDDPLRRMAYAYARRTAMAGLYFQGIVGDNVVKHVQDIFVAFQHTTGQTINFQREAAHQAFELVQAYVPRMKAEQEKALLYFARQGMTATELADREGYSEIDSIEDDPVSIDKCLDLLDEVLDSRQIPGVNSDANASAAREKTLLDLVEKSNAAKLGSFASMCEDVRASASQFVGNDVLFGASGYAILLGACGAYVAGGVHPKLIADYSATAKTLMDGIGGDEELHQACKKLAFELGSTYVRGLSPEAAEVIMKHGLQLKSFVAQGAARLSPEEVVKQAKRIARDEIA